MAKPEAVNQFAAEFAQCVKGDTAVATPSEIGRRDVDLILKIYEGGKDKHSGEGECYVSGLRVKKTLPRKTEVVSPVRALR